MPGPSVELDHSGSTSSGVRRGMGAVYFSPDWDGSDVDLEVEELSETEGVLEHGAMGTGASHSEFVDAIYS